MNVKKPASAAMTPVCGASALPRPSDAKVRLAITKSQAAKIGILDRWQAVQDRKRVRAELKSQAATLLAQAADQLIAIAQGKPEPWSFRRLAAEINIPPRTLRRIKTQKVDPQIWLPKLEAALARLKPS